MTLEERITLKQEIDRQVRERKVSRARPRASVPVEAPKPPERRFGRAQKKKPPHPFAEFSPAELRAVQRHPAFKRLIRATCPFSGLSRDELEQHVAGIVQMIEFTCERVDGGILYREVER